VAAARRRPPERPLKRRVATRVPRKTIMVFAEGERTEPIYLRALKLMPAVRDVAAVDLRFKASQSKSDPVALVSAAVRERSKAIGEEAEVDEIWCLFDVEWPRNHPSLGEAVALAADSGIRVAISNPCFELWLILHFQDHGAWLDSAAACRLRSRIDGSSGKGLDPVRYLPLIHDAARRAAQLDVRHKRDGAGFPGDNPSSGMHQFLAAIPLPGRDHV
jgi:hypothetical protein